MANVKIVVETIEKGSTGLKLLEDNVKRLNVNVGQLSKSYGDTALKQEFLKSKTAAYNDAVSQMAAKVQNGSMSLSEASAASNKLAKDLGLTETETKSLNERMGALFSTVGKLSAGVLAAGVVFKKAFDLGTEGANLNQLQQSFEFLNDSILKTPNLLNDLRAASRGTVDDTTLMEGVLKLTAGTSEELGQALAISAPRLMEIAKAAQKLNPSLGDTAFLYESISTGIKRQSPLILDNLGIVVKVGEANETYAASLGKTVAELTAEEKQMALLNATMEAGGRLIEQVGGDVSSQADSWAQLSTELANTRSELTQLFATRNQGTAGGIANTLAILNERQAELNHLHEAGAISTLQYRGATLANWTANRSLTESLDAKIAALDQEEAALQASMDAALLAAAATESFDRAMTGGASAVEQFNEILSEQEQRYRMNAAIANDYREASLDYEVTADMVKDAENARAQAHEEAAKEMEAAAEAAQKARQAQADFFNSLVGNKDAMSEWNSIMGESSTVSYQVAGRTGEQQEALEDLQSAYKRAQEAVTSYQIGVKGVGLSEEERNEKIQEQLDYMAQLDAQMQPLLAIQNEYATATAGGTVNTELLNQKLFEQIQASTDDAAAIALAGVALGQFSQEQADAMLKAALLEEFIRGQAVAFGEGRTSIEGAQEAIRNFIAELDNIPSVVQTEVRTNYTSTGTPSNYGAPVGGGGGGAHAGVEDMASGGSFVVPPGYPGDSYRVNVSSGEKVTVETPGQQMANGRGGVNLTINVYGGGAGAQRTANIVANRVVEEIGRLS